MSDEDDISVGRINVFEFKKKSFQPKNKVEVDSCSDDDDDDDDDVIVLSRAPSTSKGLIVQLDNEDDSDIEITSKPPKIKPEVSHNILLDDSDDESITLIPTATLSLDSITKARQARECLQQAQRYHAEDISEPNHEENIPLTLSNRSKGIKHSISISYMDQQITWTFYHLEPIQKVLDQLRQKFEIPLDHSIQLQRKSSKKNEEIEILDPTKTPASYEFGKLGGTEHFLLCVMDVNSSSKSSVSVSGPRLCLRVRTIRRTSNTILADETFVIRQRDTFATLAEKYRKSQHRDKTTKSMKMVKFLFEGEVLNMEDTPETHDMDSGDILEVIAP
jgi:hypothetical protein